MIEILGLAIISILITEWFEPIQKVKDYFRCYSWPVIGKILYCGKCFGLWFGLGCLGFRCLGFVQVMVWGRFWFVVWVRVIGF